MDVLEFVFGPCAAGIEFFAVPQTPIALAAVGYGFSPRGYFFAQHIPGFNTPEAHFPRFGQKLHFGGDRDYDRTDGFGYLGTSTARSSLPALVGRFSGVYRLFAERTLRFN